MYIRKSTRKHKGKTYTNYLLVESVQTPKGPRQRTICSLGSLEPAPQEEWLALAHKLDASLQGQLSLDTAQVEIDSLVAKSRRGKRRTHFVDPSSIIEVDGVPSVIAHKNRTTTSFIQIGARVGDIISERSRNLETYQGVEEATLDLYSAVRNGYLQKRAQAIRE